MAEQDDPEFVRDLSGGGQLDNQKLKRIDQNPFIVYDGTLPPLRVTRSHLETFEKPCASQQDNEDIDTPQHEENHIKQDNYTKPSSSIQQLPLDPTNRQIPQLPLDPATDCDAHTHIENITLSDNITLITPNNDTQIKDEKTHIELQFLDEHSTEESTGKPNSNENEHEDTNEDTCSTQEKLLYYGAILLAVILAGYLYRKRMKKQLEDKLKNHN